MYVCTVQEQFGINFKKIKLFENISFLYQLVYFDEILTIAFIAIVVRFGFAYLEVCFQCGL